MENQENKIQFYNVPNESRNQEQILIDSQQFKILSSDDRQIEQRTPKWYEARSEMVTASDWATAIGENPYSGRNSLLIKKATQDTSFFGSVATAWGQKYEAVANSIYEYMSEKKVHEFGLLQHQNYTYLGASPDGISEDGIMLEIKCPKSREITGIPPHYYWIQVQGQLEVCDLEVCHFLECQIKECNDEEEYWSIWTNPEKIEKIEKKQLFAGILIEFVDKNTLKSGSRLEYKYEYTGVNTIKKGQEDVLAMLRKKTSETLGDQWLEHSLTFWICDFCSIQEIKRNKEWFQLTLPKLQQFWIEVLYGRIHLLKNQISPDDHKNIFMPSADEKKKPPKKKLSLGKINSEDSLALGKTSNKNSFSIKTKKQEESKKNLLDISETVEIQPEIKQYNPLKNVGDYYQKKTNEQPDEDEKIPIRKKGFSQKKI